MPRRQIPIRGGGRTRHITPDQLIELRRQFAEADGKQESKELCFCLCHDSHDSRHLHAEPCCQVCPHCGKRIVVPAFAEHVARHSQS